MKILSLVLAAMIGTSLIASGTVGVALAGGPNPEQMPVWRVELHLVTGNVRSADSDDRVSVQLNATNRTFLNHAANDFERGDARTYDLVLDASIQTLSDITMLQISKVGSNGWCIAQAGLFVNGRPIFVQGFYALPDRCRWLDNSGGNSRAFTVNSATLRAHEMWRGYTPPNPPTRIDQVSLEHWVESIVGHAITGRDIFWKQHGAKAVGVSRRNSSTFRVDLDLASHKGVFSDTDIDVDFDLRFACAGGQFAVTMSNVTAKLNGDFITDATLGVLDFFGVDVSRIIERALSGIALPSLATPICPTSITVDAGANLIITWPRLPS